MPTKTAPVPAPHGSKKAERAPKYPLTHSPTAVRQARKAKGLSQVQLGELTGRTGSHISEIEQGTRDAREELLGRLADALGCQVRDLRRVPATRKCPACEYTFDPPWDGKTLLHLNGNDWCPGGGKICVGLA